VSNECSLSDLNHALSLSGEWEFQLDPADELDVGSLRPDRRIRVPLPWQAAAPDLRHYAGWAWYRTAFDALGDLADGDLRLRFGAVDYWCEVFLNGTRVGTHEGGYTPFELGVRTALRGGRNELAVHVFDPVQTAVVARRWPDDASSALAETGRMPFAASDVPHGKQDWYVNTGGIWQDVTLTPVPATWISRIHVASDVKARAALVEVQLAGRLGPLDGQWLRLTVRAADTIVAKKSVPLTTGRSAYRVRLPMPEIRPWTPEDPFLYELSAEVGPAGRQARRATRFGMRSFETRDGRFVLNGVPTYLRGVLDQDFHARTVATVPSREELRAELLQAKQLGFNCLRCHIKPPDPMYLDLADELGLLVWEELPSWRTYWAKGTVGRGALTLPDDVRRRVEATLVDVVERDFNHPSVVIRTLVNEDWGTALPLVEADRRWLVQLVDQARALDPGRLVVDNSACSAPWGTSFHLASDVDDFHLYATIPDQARDFAAAIDDLALRPLWSFSSFGDGRRSGDEPIVLSEFGNWGLPTMAQLGAGGDEPDWFDVAPWGGAGWEQEPGLPAGARERFERDGLASIWPDFDAFAAATQRHQAEALRFEVEELRRRPAIAGYVVTQLSDTYWESNGLLDFERNPKVAARTLPAVNRDCLVVARPQRESYWSGEAAGVEVSVCAPEDRLRPGIDVRWRLDDGATSGVAGIDPSADATVATATITVQLPVVSAAKRLGITIAAVGPGGTELATARLAPLVLPARLADDPQPDLCVIRAGPSAVYPAGLSERLATLGYAVTEASVPTTAIAVGAAASPELLAWIRAGGRLLFLANDRSPFFWLQGRGGAAQGWITSWSWIRPEIHPRLAGIANPLGLEFVDVMPATTIAGLAHDRPEIQGDILAGAITGWVHHPTAHTVRFRYGRGIVLMTTFRLADAIGRDSVATAMFEDLVAHLAGPGCEPTLTANY
jgi:hypothetical protein